MNPIIFLAQLRVKYNQYCFSMRMVWHLITHKGWYIIKDKELKTKELRAGTVSPDEVLRGTLSIGKLGLTRRILALSLVTVSMYVSEFIVSPLDKKSIKKNSQQNFTWQGYMLSF